MSMTRGAYWAVAWLVAVSCFACSSSHGVEGISPLARPGDGGVNEGDDADAAIDGSAGADNGGTGAATAGSGDEPGASSMAGSSGGAGTSAVAGMGSAGTGGGSVGGTGGPAGGGTGTTCTGCEVGTTTFGEFPGCCTPSGGCGYMIAGQCVEQNAPGVQTDACPQISFGGFINLIPCCRADGTCGGVVEMTLPLGCVSQDVASGIFGGFGAAATGPAQSCSELP